MAKEKGKFYPGDGRPALYKTPEEFKAKVQEYFDAGCRRVKRKHGDGYIEVPKCTITGLALYMGFSSRQSFYDYRKREEFKEAVEWAHTMIEMIYEEFLTENNPTGSIFALKQFGWKDKSEHEMYGKGGAPLVNKVIVEFKDAKNTEDRSDERAEEDAPSGE